MTTKRGSKAAAKRAMQAEAARMAALLVPAPLLEAEYEAKLDSFTPRGMSRQDWDRLGPFVRDTMRRSHVQGMKVFGQLLSELSLFLIWAFPTGTPTIQTALRHDLIEDWVRAKGSEDSTTWGNRRSRLRNLASHVNPGPDAPKRLEPFKRQAIKAPYTRQEVADLERFALNQPTPTKRRQLCAMVGFGLGAGLGSVDLRHLRRFHVVTDESGALWVDVPGDRPRRVPIRDRYVSFVEKALAGLKHDQLVLGRVADRNSITGHVREDAAVGATNTAPDQARLRATWLMLLMTAPISIAEVMEAAGLTTARVIPDLLPYCRDERYVAFKGGESS